MKIVRLALAALALAAVPLRAQDAGELRLSLNIPELVLRVHDGDRVIKEYPVSPGLPGFDTPDGSFNVQRAEWNPWWRPPAREWAKDDKVTPPGPNNPMGRVKLYFAPYYFLHGTPHEKDLGTPASHGCVRMRNADVIELATLLHRRVGATVAPSEIPAILARPSATRSSSFRGPVPLEITYQPVVVRDGEIRVYRDIYKRGRIHTEGVYQALIAAGYDVSRLDRAAVNELVGRARTAKGVFRASLSEALGVERTATAVAQD
ncbi:MAG TPA: L,D-transpeptidase [Longimicrobiaceae bacterium]|nr:L,D-transpeptidase [Longimicrobiaceae bacterium]